MLAEQLTQIDKIIEIISQYVNLHIQNGTENNGTIKPIIYQEQLDKLALLNNKNDYLIEILNKYVANDKQLIPLVWPYMDVERADYIFDIIDVIKEVDEFKSISLKNFLNLTLKINRKIIDEDIYSKYSLYRMAQDVYSIQEMNIMEKDIFSEAVHIFNEPVELTELSCVTCEIDSLEFMKYIDNENIQTATGQISQFLGGLIEDFIVKFKLKVDKITCINSCFNIVFIGVKDKQLIEKFLNELPNIYKEFRKAEGSSYFGYSEHKTIVHKYLDYLCLDNTIVEKKLNPSIKLHIKI